MKDESSNRSSLNKNGLVQIFVKKDWQISQSKKGKLAKNTETNLVPRL